MAERRICACKTSIEAESDPQSVAHALRVHYATQEHQDYVDRQKEADELASVDVPLRNGWAGVTASLTRVG